VVNCKFRKYEVQALKKQGGESIFLGNMPGLSELEMIRRETFDIVEQKGWG